jgi:hypothetical protein
LDAAIRIEGLVKKYADVVAVDGLDLEVAGRVLRPARAERGRQDDLHRRRASEGVRADGAHGF